MLYFITGAGGSGKTSCMPYLKERLPDMPMHDFDEVGVPTNADKRWRQETTELWIKSYLENYDTFCLFGQMVLGEILACPSIQLLCPVKVCLLDCSDIERNQRLRKRGSIPTQDMLSWAAWLRVHQEDPQWCQRVIKEHCWENLNFTLWDNRKEWGELASLRTIDTTNLSLSQVASQLEGWISSLY